MANPDYSFLNDYLSKVTDQSDKVDPDTDMGDDNEFFNTQSDEPEVNEDIQYGITTDQDQQEQFEDSEEQQNVGDNNVLDYLLGNDDPYSEQGDDAEADESNVDDADDVSNAGGNVPPTRGSGEGSLGSKISANESGGKYNAMNHHGGGAGAVGKYQFRWNIWKDSIEKITGVKSREDFQHSPQAQEKYFSWYEKHYLKPAADNSMGLNDDQLAQLVHFRGAGGAKKYLLGKMKDKPESYNVPISKYIAKHQAGGQVPIARTSNQQFNGLNNGSFDEMMFPMEGENTFRGLDNDEPVYLEDESGKKKVLKGKHDTVKMTGKVYEKRLNK